MDDKKPIAVSMNPWVPITNPLDLTHLGKFMEELAEANAAAARCIIQGIDECEPVTGKPNREWLEDEIADVLANVTLVIQHFDLNSVWISNRKTVKMDRLREWHAMLKER